MAKLAPEDFASTYSLPLPLVEAAYANLERGSSRALAFSGKLGSGKDTVAAGVLSTLEITDAKHEFFARALKEECSRVMGFAFDSADLKQAKKLVSSELQVSLSDAGEAVSAIWKDVKESRITDANIKTLGTRHLLQFWGTEVRRKQDENYWVKKSLIPIFQQLAEDNTVFITDARFPNEVDALQHFGAFATRLMVSEKEQARRIFLRDGIAVAPQARAHSSETALDAYEAEGRFDFLVNTDGISSAEVVELTVSAITLTRLEAAMLNG